MFDDTASALFGVEGLQVTGVEPVPGGGIEVWAVTDCEAAAACPECSTVSDRVHETVVTRPRDVRRAGDAVDLRWVKYRRKCGNQQCPRKTFTEWVPGTGAAAVRRPGVRHQGPARAQPGASVSCPVRQDHRHLGP